MKIFTLMLIPLILVSCNSAKNKYESSSYSSSAEFRKVELPLKAGTAFFVHQGAFGKDSHSEPGFEYRWDLDVPYGTDVVSVDNGVVLSIWEPDQGGGCDKKYADDAHNVKIIHDDGTVAQYTHVKSLVTIGESVERGEVIATTAENGWICSPHLDFAMFRSKNNLYGSAEPITIPIYFVGIKDGLLLEGRNYEVPR